MPRIKSKLLFRICSRWFEMHKLLPLIKVDFVCGWATIRPKLVATNVI